MIVVEDEFDDPSLDQRIWLPNYLPHWSSRSASAARYLLTEGTLRLLIEPGQAPWCPEFDGWLRVSSLQTGAWAGPVGSSAGQHRFRSGLVVREEQPPVSLYTPQYGLFEARLKAIDDPDSMVALWMIGYEDEPRRSAEICICEIFGREMTAVDTAIGMGVRAFGDPTIVDEFDAPRLPIDAREFHTYAAEWTPGHVAFYVDDRLVRVVHQSPDYPMQFMLSAYEFADGPDLPSPAESYPKAFVVDWFRGYRRRA